jgi:hypothetical protein
VQWLREILSLRCFAPREKASLSPTRAFPVCPSLVAGLVRVSKHNWQHYRAYGHKPNLFRVEIEEADNLDSLWLIDEFFGIKKVAAD